MESLFQDISKTDLSGNGGSDDELDAVVTWLESRAAVRGGAETFYGAALRKTLNEVPDGPRTGGWGFNQLEKTEKTYVGTKLEIVLRTALELDRAFPMDLEIEGVPVDIKWSMQSVSQ
ncbi:MAG TPA: NaeI family type II restriction endonuclease, partial [Naasia sp.]